MTNFHPYS